MTGWGLVVYRDGEAVTGVLPCDDWAAGSAVAEIFADLFGGPISLAAAVIANQPKRQPPPQRLFEEVA